MSTVVATNGFLLQKKMHFSSFYSQELQIPREIEKDVINLEVIRAEARKICVNERPGKKKDIFKSIKS